MIVEIEVAIGVTRRLERRQPDVDPDGPLQMQISNLDYNSYVGAIAVGRVTRGVIRPNQQITVVKYDGEQHRAKVGLVYGYLGLERHEVEEAAAGDIIAITGIEAPNVSDTLCDTEHVEALPALSVDEPTVSMTFQVNSSPFAGKEGKYLTSRQLKERLERELIHNVALRVEEGPDPEKFKVSGRGELHLSVLLESMRREGFELAVSRPEVIFREVDGEVCEPYEQLTVDVEEQHQGAIMEALGSRKGDLRDMQPDGQGRVRLDYIIPSRGLIGFQTDFMTTTSGTGLMYHVFDHYGPAQHGGIAPRKNGVLIANGAGKALGYALFNLQERGRLFIGHGEALHIEFENPIDEDEAREALRNAPGISVVDHRADEGYVTPVECAGDDQVYVSRLRDDPTVEVVALGCVEGMFMLAVVVDPAISEVDVAAAPMIYLPPRGAPQPHPQPSA